MVKLKTEDINSKVTYTTKEAATYLGLSLSTIYRMEKRVGSWLSASDPYVIAPVEVIIILYKERWKKISGGRKSDISKEEP